MIDAPRSPSEYYVRFLISRANVDDFKPTEILDEMAGLALDGLNSVYIERLKGEMGERPSPYLPQDPRDTKTRNWLRSHRIFDMWHQTDAVRESLLILVDRALRDKLEPLLLSSLNHNVLARRLRKFTSIALTSDGISAYAHYFWNRKVLSQTQWLEYLEGRTYANAYRQSLMAAPDVALQHLPWVLRISGPPGESFDSSTAAARVGQIAFKHALELEHVPATIESTTSLRNCMVTIEKADNIMRKSDVALRDVLKQFTKFRMRVDDASVIDVHALTAGNYSKSGEGTDVSDDEDF